MPQLNAILTAANSTARLYLHELPVAAPEAADGVLVHAEAIEVGVAVAAHGQYGRLAAVHTAVRYRDRILPRSASAASTEARQ